MQERIEETTAVEMGNEKKKKMERSKYCAPQENNECVTTWKTQEKLFHLTKVKAKLGITVNQVYYVSHNKEFQQDERNYFIPSKTHISWLSKQLKEMPIEQLYSMNQLYKNFLQKFEFNERALSHASFRRLLKRFAKASFKLPQKKDRRSLGHSHLDSRFDYSLYYLSMSSYQMNFVFLDETSMGHASNPSKCWQSGKEHRTLVHCERQSNISIMGAIGTNHFFAYQLVLGNINSSIFNYHLIQLIRKLKDHYGENNFILTLDNFQAHKSKLVQKTLTSVMSRFLPTYSPQLNAIEKIWQTLKMNINKQGMLLQTGIYQKIHEFFNRLKNNELDSYIYSILPYLEKSLNRIEY